MYRFKPALFFFYIMSSPIGFILLTHRAPQQILRLVGKLNTMFDQPPIVAHHDFGKCALPLDEITPNVQFVRPHLKTAWAQWPVVEGTARAIAQMYGAPQPPRRFVVLSGADYPIKPAAKILSDLEAGDYDAHITYFPVRYGELNTRMEKLAYKRYCTKTFLYPSLNKWLRPRTRELNIGHPRLTKYWLPFVKEGLQCYAGWQWFCGSEKAANVITEFHRTRPALSRYYSRSHRPDACPEESYYQTILCNTPGLKIFNDDLRYTDWSGGGAHPKTLGMEDLPALLASTKHFARKFDETNTQVLDELDAVTK